MPGRSHLLRLVLLSGAILVALSAAAVAQEPFEEVRDEIRRALERDAAPSLAVAVVRDGRILWEEGFGWANRERKLAATPHTPYSIASISKPLTATGVMVLVEQDRLQLDRPANDYLAEAKLTAHRGDVQQATVRRLANHTAGLPLHYQFFYSDESHPRPARSESIRRYGHLLEPPGSEFQYANFGYGILDELITLRSGREYADFMQQEVFKPLGMRHTAIGIPAGQEENVAVRYGPDKAPLPFYDFDHPGASAVFSSAHDLARFALLHLKQKQPDQRAVLSEESITEMQRPTATSAPGQHYGIGWFVQDSEFGYRTVSHTGGMGGVRCRLVLVPAEKIGVVVLCNSNTDLPLRISREILGALLPDYGVAMRKFQEHQPNREPGRPSAPPELVGFWRGTVQTYRGETQFHLWAQPDGDVKIRLGSQLITLLNHSRLENDLLTGDFAGDIGTDDANRRPYQLRLRVRRHGEQLTGAVTAISLPSSRAGNALSYWVELSRVDPDPGVWSLFNGHDLDGWRIADEIDFERHGNVSVRDRQIVLEAGRPATGIVLAGKPPRMNYELSWETKRIEGSDFFCGLTFPVGDHYLSLILGGWGGGVTGISNLDGAAAVENETTGFRDFKQDQWYAVRLRVTPGKVQVWLDGESLVDTDITGRKLSIWWEQEPMRPLGFATWNTAGALRQIHLKRLPEPATSPPFE